MICAAVLALALGVATAAADVYPGDYAAKGKGVSAKLHVANGGGGTLAYSMKTACGKSKGKLSLKKSGAGLKGRRVSRGPENTIQTVVGKVALSGDGAQVVGTVRQTLKGGDSELAGCHAKRSFAAGVGGAEGFVPSRDTGHYAGTGPNGLPISFDVVDDGDEIRVENLAADVQADCYDESDPDADDFSMTTHVAGMTGRIANDGTFYVDYTPDDDTEYEFDGELGDGEAQVDVMIGGLFDAAGNPSPAGPYACDSWGDPYGATLQ